MSCSRSLVVGVLIQHDQPGTRFLGCRGRCRVRLGAGGLGRSRTDRCGGHRCAQIVVVISALQAEEETQTQGDDQHRSEGDHPEKAGTAPGGSGRRRHPGRGCRRRCRRLGRRRGLLRRDGLERPGTRDAWKELDDLRRREPVDECGVPDPVIGRECASLRQQDQLSPLEGTDLPTGPLRLGVEPTRSQRVTVHSYLPRRASMRQLTSIEYIAARLSALDESAGGRAAIFRNVTTAGLSPSLAATSLPA